MIYLITGSPGTGKTAMAVSMILENYDGLFRMKAEDGLEINRPLYFCHIDGLDTKKLKAHELSEADIQAAPLKEVVPTGSVVIVDEADYTYPVRSASREVPPYIKTLKELRFLWEYISVRSCLITAFQNMVILGLLMKMSPALPRMMTTKCFQLQKFGKELSMAVKIA